MDPEDRRPSGGERTDAHLWQLLNFAWTLMLMALSLRAWAQTQITITDAAEPEAEPTDAAVACVLQRAEFAEAKKEDGLWQRVSNNTPAEDPVIDDPVERLRRRRLQELEAKEKVDFERARLLSIREQQARAACDRR